MSALEARPEHSFLNADARPWVLALALLPFFYFLALCAPVPMGLGLQWANDFAQHRIWYTQMDAYFLGKGYFPLWNPSFEMGSPYLAVAFGTALLYPLRWWTYIPTYFGGPANYVCQYVQISAHLALALLGLFAVLRRHGGLSNGAAALAATLLLFTQSFNNLIRFPHAPENFSWLPWIFYFALNLAVPPVTRTSSARSTACDALALALCTAMSWLTGYGQYSYVGALSLVVVLLFSTRSLAGLSIAVAAGVSGTMLAIGAIWPAVEWVSSHPLRAGRDISGINVVGVTEYADMLLRPFGVDVHYSVFTFPVFVGLAIVGCFAAWAQPVRRLSLGMLACLILLIDNGRGLDGLSFRFLYNHLPLFGSFNSPSKNVWIAFIPLAWFTGHGVDSLLSRQRLRPWAMGAVTLMCLFLVLGYSSSLPENGKGIWRPLERFWLDSSTARRSYFWLVCGSSGAIIAYVHWHRRRVRVAMLYVLCFLFVRCYARYNTWVSESFDRQAVMSAGEAYPQGLLARRVRAAYMGLTGIGVTSPTVDPLAYDLIMNAQPDFIGDESAQFPSSRFRWFPSGVAADLTLRLKSFGPNHIDFDVEAAVSGRLWYLAKFSAHWWSNHAYERVVPPGEFYQFAVAPGRTSFHMAFVPVSHIAACVFTLVGLFATAGAWVRLHGRRGLSVGIVLCGAALAGLLLVGAFTRHSMSSRDLFGVRATSLDPTGRLPSSPPP